MIRDLVEYLVKNIVQKPDLVRVDMKENDEVITLEISVDVVDRGKVIGRDGFTIKTLRSLLGIVIPLGNKKIVLDIAAQQ